MLAAIVNIKNNHTGKSLNQYVQFDRSEKDKRLNAVICASIHEYTDFDFDYRLGM